MAPRKRLLIDDPPSATTTTSESSDDENNDYIQLPSSKKQPVVEGEEEIEDDDSSSEELQHSQPASQNPPPSNTKLKPLASKPIKAQPQVQSSAQAQTTPKSGKKRVADDINANGNTIKRSKGKETVSAAAGGSGGRIFSEEDELAILRGVADFLSKTGKDPLKNIAAFHGFVKKSLGATVSNQQLKRKVRGLKEKFESSDSFNKTHDKKAFELFKKINWGNNGGNVAREENGGNVNVVKHVGSSSKNVESGVDNNFILNEIFRFSDAMGLCLNKDVGKKGLDMIGESRRAEMERQLRQLHVTEWEVFVNRAQLVKEHTSLILE